MQTFTFADNDSLMVVALLLKRLGGHVLITEDELVNLDMYDTKIITADNYVKGGIDIWVK